MENPGVFEVFINYFSGGAKGAPKIDFGRLLRPFGSPLGTFFEHVGGSVALLGHCLGPKWSQTRQDEGLLGSGRGARGSQRVSGFDSETIFIICCVLFLVSLCVCLARKVLCIHFGTLTWSFGVFSFMSAFQHGILTWLQRRIAFCSCFSKSVLDVVKAAPQARPKTT